MWNVRPERINLPNVYEICARHKFRARSGRLTRFASSWHFVHSDIFISWKQGLVLPICGAKSNWNKAISCPVLSMFEGLDQVLPKFNEARRYSWTLTNVSRKEWKKASFDRWIVLATSLLTLLVPRKHSVHQNVCVFVLSRDILLEEDAYDVNWF